MKEKEFTKGILLGILVSTMIQFIIMAVVLFNL
jgi:large-conductance mechanosensitive channel